MHSSSFYLITLSNQSKYLSPVVISGSTFKIVGLVFFKYYSASMFLLFHPFKGFHLLDLEDYGFNF